MTSTRFRPAANVVLAHPDPTVRRAISGELAADGIAVVAEVGGGTEAVEVGRSLLPDVAVLGAALSGPSAAEVCRTLRAEVPVVRVLLVSDDDGDAALEGLEAGAYGCWLRTTPQLPVVDAVRGTMRRESLPTPRWAQYILASYDRLAAEEDQRIVPPPTLTEIEGDVLARIAAGATPVQVAGELELTSHLVRMQAGYAIIKLYRALADERQMQSLR